MTYDHVKLYVKVRGNIRRDHSKLDKLKQTQNKHGNSAGCFVFESEKTSLRF